MFLPWILVFFLDVYAIYCLWQERPTARRLIFWIAIIFLFPAIGAIAYLLFFRRPRRDA